MAGPRRSRFRVHCWARVGKKQLPVLSDRWGDGPRLSVISVQSAEKKYLMFVAVLLRRDFLTGWLEKSFSPGPKRPVDAPRSSGRKFSRGFWLTVTHPRPYVFCKCCIYRT